MPRSELPGHQTNASDGLRILVDRLSPHGLSKDKACIDLWIKEVAPSSALRAERERHTVTLLYGAREKSINHARVLADVITERGENGPVELSSPPCFLHELNPVWLGTENHDERSAPKEREADEQPANTKASRGRSQ